MEAALVDGISSMEAALEARVRLPMRLPARLSALLGAREVVDLRFDGGASTPNECACELRPVASEY